MNKSSSVEEQLVASVLAKLQQERPPEDSKVCSSNTAKMSQVSNADTKKSKSVMDNDDVIFEYTAEPTVIQVIRKPKTYQNHSYRDFSKVPPSIDYVKKTEIEEMTFAEKLHEILAYEPWAKAISWMPHGRSFRVNIPKALEQKKILMKYFGHNRYSSFLRQLNNNGFKHITHGPDRNCYYHECFLRNLPHLLKYMPKAKDARRLIPSPQDEPDLYEISKKYPIPGCSLEIEEGGTDEPSDKKDEISPMYKDIMDKQKKEREATLRVIGESSQQQPMTSVKPALTVTSGSNAVKLLQHERPVVLQGNPSKIPRISIDSFPALARNPMPASLTHLAGGGQTSSRLDIAQVRAALNAPSLVNRQPQQPAHMDSQMSKLAFLAARQRQQEENLRRLAAVRSTSNANAVILTEIMKGKMDPRFGKFF